MSENNGPADAGGDPNTVRELQRARADLVKLRDELKSARGERDAATAERDDAIKSRDGYKGQIEKQKADYEAKLTEANAATEKATTDAAAAIAEKDASYQQGLIRANAEAAFTRAGAVNPEDAVKLADLSSVKFEDGKIIGLDEVVTASKEARGYLFTEAPKPGSVTGNTTTKTPPKPGEAGPFDAMTSDPKAYEAEKARALAAARSQA